MRIFKADKLMIENEFYPSIDIKISAEVKDIELEDNTTYERNI